MDFENAEILSERQIDDFFKCFNDIAQYLFQKIFKHLTYKYQKERKRNMQNREQREREICRIERKDGREIEIEIEQRLRKGGKDI